MDGDEDGHTVRYLHAGNHILKETHDDLDILSQITYKMALSCTCSNIYRAVLLPAIRL